MAKAGLTARRTCRAGAKAEHSEPTVRIRCGRRLSDKSYSGDNRLVLPKSPNRRQCSAPRCRLILSWGWRRSQGFGCSPIKKVRELGSNRSTSQGLACKIDAFRRCASEIISHRTSGTPRNNLLARLELHSILRSLRSWWDCERFESRGKIKTKNC